MCTNLHTESCVEHVVFGVTVSMFGLTGTAGTAGTAATAGTAGTAGICYPTWVDMFEKMLCVHKFTHGVVCPTCCVWCDG